MPKQQEEKRVWRWYYRHDKAINALLDIACDLIPGGKPVFQALRAFQGTQEDEQEQEHGQKVEELEAFLSEVKHAVCGLVEDIEEIKGFKRARSAGQMRTVLLNSYLSQEVDEAVFKIGQSLTASVPTFQPRLINGRYALLRRIGSGGQGEVYQGFHQMANIEVAVKLLPRFLARSSATMAMLQKEYGRVVNRLTHPNIVQYRDLGRDNYTGQLFLVMDFVKGKNLRELLIERHNKAMGVFNAISLLKPIAEALEFAHENKVVHCDLKPENILIRDGDQKMLLTDFGLAKEIRNTLSAHPNHESNIGGTLAYMAPEQYKARRVSAKTDIWALGVILYELVSGMHPFAGVSFEHYMKLICEINPNSPEILSRKQWKLLKKMLSKDSASRPSSATEALRELSRAPTRTKSGHFRKPPKNKGENQLQEMVDLKCTRERHKPVQIKRERIEKTMTRPSPAGKDVFTQLRSAIAAIASGFIFFFVSALIAVEVVNIPVKAAMSGALIIAYLAALYAYWKVCKNSTHRSENL